MNSSMFRGMNLIQYKMNAHFKMSFICCIGYVFSPYPKPCQSAETSRKVIYLLMKKIYRKCFKLVNLFSLYQRNTMLQQPEIFQQKNEYQHSLRNSIYTKIILDKNKIHVQKITPENQSQLNQILFKVLTKEISRLVSLPLKIYMYSKITQCKILYKNTEPSD